MNNNAIDVSSFKLENIDKKYEGLKVLAPLSLCIEKGARVAIIGPSGSGKTTLLNILANIVQPDSGALHISGEDARKLRPGRALSEKVGIIHQQLDLVDQIPVIHNVLAGRLGQWGLWRSLLSLIVPQDQDLALKVLQKVGLAEKMYQRTSRLSGGEQQRVAIARLMVQQPEIILADEPVSSLDPSRAEDLLQLLVSIAQEANQTLIASLHSVEFARKYFSRVIALRQGRIFFDLPADKVSDDHLANLYDLKG